MKAYERLLSYARVFTPSDENSASHPSSSCQFDLAKQLVKELKELGVTDAFCDEFCYVYGHIPATPGMESHPGLGFIAHMDTVSDFCDHAACPVVTENYDGCALPLGTSGRTLSPDMFPHLPSLKGRTLITTDGTTVLGADDKAGIAEIMTMIERLNNENIPHGPLSIGFTPDEEIGSGADNFNLEAFHADFAYTLDGGPEGEIEFENFNACKAVVKFTGVNVHPGTAKDTMVNASLVAMEFDAMLPSGDRPCHTDDYEGFYHLTSMSGDVSNAVLNYIIRDHHADSFAFRQTAMEHAAALLNEKYGEGTVILTITQQYRNMSEIIAKNPELIDYAKAAAKDAGLEPKVLPIRGGTDGARLSFMGLPCPNLGTGGYAYHGPYEHITAEGMDSAVNMVLKLIEIFGREK